MRTKAAIAGHPVHPALVAFPVAFYTATLVALIAFHVTGDAFWFRVALVANVAGVVMAGVAAIPGAIDLFGAVERGTPARTTGLQHAALNVTALVLFASSAVLLWTEWDDWSDAASPALRGLHATLPMVLAAIGVAATVAAGALGWKLVQSHHVGVIDRAPRTTLPPRVRPHGVR
jgi:uncharacterized membrane protein